MRAPAPSLREPGRILLLSCYDMGQQPGGLASAAAFLQQAGFRPALADLSIDPLEPEPVRRAALVALYVPMHTALLLALRAAEGIRRVHPAAHVCFYGLYAPLNAELVLAGAGDSVIGGEFEVPLVALAEALEAGEATQPAGVAFPGAPAAPRLARTRFPVPAREALPPLERYARLAHGGTERLAGRVEASRGCKHLCRHCPIPPVYGGRFFVVPREVVLADIDALVAQGARHITFGDPDFLNGPRHALEIMRGLHARHPGVTFDATIKVEHLLRYRHLLPELARCGCLFIVSAVESLSDEVLAHLDKGHTRADATEALALTRAAGIALRPTFVAFTPWTRLEDYLALLDFIAAEGLLHHVDPVQLSLRLLVPPGSSLLDSEAFAPFRGELDREALTYRWRHPDPRMDDLQREVAAIVEEAARDEAPAEATFTRVLGAARAAAGAPDGAPWAMGAAPPAPRLTEAWFC